MFCARLADAKQVLRGRVDRLNQQTAVQNDNAGVQTVEDLVGPRRLGVFLFSCGWVG